MDERRSRRRSRRRRRAGERADGASLAGGRRMHRA